VVIDPKHPPSRDTLQDLHDRVQGPRDTNGRRIFTAEVCDLIRSVRAKTRGGRSQP
jgi:hypothetical protein